ncbi:MAG: hypothetical protein GXP19_06080 [Gammaproteobacteria bacterium]|nr:hypothetical protein [Gammaproteobacteria bacterium]
MKIAYFGYDFFSAALAALLADGQDVYRVYTVPCDNQVDHNQYIFEMCREHKIPVTQERVDAQIINQLHNEGCELLVTAAYYYKIPDLSSTTIKGINIHPTLLPIGRGVMPLPWIILKNLKQCGVTIHKLTQEYDAGDILRQQSFPITEHETFESLSARLQLLAKDLLLEVVTEIDRFWDNATPQGDDASYWPRPDKDQRSLDWHKPVEELERICRAFGKTGCFARFDNKNWSVYGLNAWTQSHNYEIGTVVHKTNSEMIVAAADGLVSLLYFRLEL